MLHEKEARAEAVALLTSQAELALWRQPGRIAMVGTMMRRLLSQCHMELHEVGSECLKGSGKG